MIEIFADDDEITRKTWGEMYNIYSANEDLNDRKTKTKPI